MEIKVYETPEKVRDLTKEFEEKAIVIGGPTAILVNLGNFVDDSYKDKKSGITSYDGNYHVSVRISDKDIVHFAIYSPEKESPVVLEIKEKGLAKKIKEILELDS